MFHQNSLPFALVKNLRVVVDLQKPDTEVFINQEVIPQKFEAETSLFLVNNVLGGQQGIDDDVLHARVDVGVHVEIQIWEQVSDVVFELIVENGVALFVLAKGLFVIDLETLVGQMNL